MEKEKRKESSPPGNAPFQDMWPELLIVVLVVIVILTLLGPTIGNIFSNTSRGSLTR